MDWNIGYLDTVESWLEHLNKEQLKAVSKELRLLELCGNELKLPHSKALGGGLFELREMKYGLRLYYTFDRDKAILLIHAGDKNSQEADIRKARNLIERWRGDKS